MSLQTENLHQLLGGYFHEDWVLDHLTAEECLGQLLREAPLEQQRAGVDEITRLLNAGICENQIRDLLLYECGCAYAFESDGWDASSWLAHVRSRLQESLEQKQSGTSGV